ncbi:hypothetical protein Tco_0043162, partial [Tanacetum coccineum]
EVCKHYFRLSTKSGADVFCFTCAACNADVCYTRRIGTWWDRMGKLTVTGMKDMATLLGNLIPGQ